MTSKASPAVVPQYVRIADDLRDKVKDGTYGPGALLPSRNEITEMYGVSAITATHALSRICQEGYAKAERGKGHIVRRRRARMTLPVRLYAGPWPDPQVPLELRRVDVYQEVPPDNIALPLQADDAPVWVRRAVWAAVQDHQPMQIHVSWLTGVPAGSKDAISGADPKATWPEAIRQLTGRAVTAVTQNNRARRANPFEAEVFGVPDGTAVFVAHLTTYDSDRRPIDHSRYTWPTEAVRTSDYYTYPG